jgi:hypothetical protein
MLDFEKKGKEVCATHFIRAVILEELVLWHLHYVSSFVVGYEDLFRDKMNAKRIAERKNRPRFGASRLHKRSGLL